MLRAALDVTVRRFPSIAVRLRRGVFWYYLEEITKAPAIEEDKSYPLVHVPFDDVRKCAFRVLVYGSRIAVEFFHAVTDGTGGLIFLKTLVAEYLCQKYKINIPAENGVLGRLEDPDPEELEDSFLRYAGDITASRAEQTAYHMSGTPEPDGFLNLTTLMLPVPAVKEKAKEFGVSVTEFIAAVMMKAISDLQNEKVPRRMRRKPVKVLLPVNLRGLFPSRTMRNFASYVTPEIDPRLGDYSLAEICRIVHYRMGLENDPRMMAATIATNVASERSAVLRVMPLFVKKIAMKAGVRHGGRDQILPVPVQPRSCQTAGGNGSVCCADGLHHRRAGQSSAQLRRRQLERYHVYQHDPEHPRAGAGISFLPCAAHAGAARQGREQPALGMNRRLQKHVLCQMRR